MSTLRCAVLLAGCGRYDGSDVQEAVCVLNALSEAGIQAACFAPDKRVGHSVNHVTGESYSEPMQNIYIESARITGGSLGTLADFDATEWDGLVIPGGFGVSKHLCTFSFDGVNARIDDNVRLALRSVQEQGKPILALSIAPVLLVLAFEERLRVTIGSNPSLIDALQKMGADPVASGVGDYVVDTCNRVISTPCYMADVAFGGPLASSVSITHIARAVNTSVSALAEMMKKVESHTGGALA